MRLINPHAKVTEAERGWLINTTAEVTGAECG